MMWATLEPEVLPKLPAAARNGVATGIAARAEATDWKRCIDALLDIRLLEPDWDGQGAPAPAPEVVDSAIVLAVLLRQKHVIPPTETVQSVAGSVVLNWQWPDRSSFEIEVLAPDVADVYLMPAGKPVQHWQIAGAGFGARK
jgi:hypothetical protein